LQRKNEVAEGEAGGTGRWVIKIDQTDTEKSWPTI